MGKFKNEHQNKEEELLEQQEIREKYLGLVEELDKVKKIVMLPNTNFMTTRAVAEYFEISQDVVRDNIRRSREELEQNGMTFKKYGEIKELLNRESISQLKIPNSGTNVFTKRAILNLAMLLRDSSIARKIRSHILNAYEAAPDEVKLTAIERERQMMLDIIYADTDGERAVALSELNNFKNQHINQLENVIAKQDPKVKIHDEIVASINTVDMMITAKNIGVGEYKLFEFLRATKVLFKQGGDNYPYQQYQNDGYFKIVTSTKKDKYDRDYTFHTTKVTGSGKIFILNLVNKYGGAEKINSLKMKEIKGYVRDRNAKMTVV